MVRTSACSRVPLLIQLCAWLVLLTAPAFGKASTDQACDAAVSAVAQSSVVPTDILRAIARTESGRTRNGIFSAWPWTVNVGGKGTWLENSDAALKFTHDQIRSGIQNFDVGCFQLNYRWHHQAFGSLEEMFDPFLNAKYASEFLEKLYREFGNWEEAVGAYHSRTPKHAKRYKRAFRAQLAALDSPLPEGVKKGVVQTNRVKRNQYPLLVNTAGRGERGSVLRLPRSGAPRDTNSVQPLFELGQ